MTETTIATTETRRQLISMCGTHYQVEPAGTALDTPDGVYLRWLFLERSITTGEGAA